MEQKLIENIEYYRWKHNWTVTIKDFYGLMLKTLGVSEVMRCFINHENDYCMLIKSNPTSFSHCVNVSNRNLRDKLKKRPASEGGFLGICYGGVCEYVVPVYYKEDVIGALIVGSFQCSAERRKTTFERLHEEFGFDCDALQETYQKHLKNEPSDLPLIQHQATMWASYLQMLCERNIEEESIRDAIRMAEKGKDSYDNKLHQAIEYINNHLSSPISVEQVARACYCSESGIAHLFKNTLNISVNAFIIRERLMLAERMLVHTDQPIAEIAVKCGFGSNKYMTGMFKKKLGTTPIEYRTKNRQKSE